jgi:hypothetical protein
MMAPSPRGASRASTYSHASGGGGGGYKRLFPKLLCGVLIIAFCLNRNNIITNAILPAGSGVQGY